MNKYYNDLIFNKNRNWWEKHAKAEAENAEVNLTKQTGGDTDRKRYHYYQPKQNPGQLGNTRSSSTKPPPRYLSLDRLMPAPYRPPPKVEETKEVVREYRDQSPPRRQQVMNNSSSVSSLQKNQSQIMKNSSLKNQSSFKRGQTYTDLIPIEKQSLDFQKERDQVIKDQGLRAKVEGITAAEAMSLETLAKALEQIATTDIEKAWAIFYWQAKNIMYNIKGKNSGNPGDQSAIGVLKSRSAVCAGYTNLYNELAKLLGLEVKQISGYSKGAGYNGGIPELNHEWNSVKIGDAWYLMDPTWGAGTVNGDRYNPDLKPWYFLTQPQQFALEHLAKEEDDQLLQNPINLNQFANMPHVKPQFFECGIVVISPLESNVSVKDRLQVKLKVPEGIGLLCSVKQNGTIIENASFCQVDEGIGTVDALFHVKGSYDLLIFAGAKAQAHNLALIYHVTASGSTGGNHFTFPKLFSARLLNDNIILIEPMTNNFKIGDKIKFKIKSRKAKKADIIEVNTRTSLASLPNGIFEGVVQIQSNIIKIGVSDGGSIFSSFVEYRLT
jgi:hypothetical protein